MQNEKNKKMRVAWYLNRLSKMPLPEIPFRVKEKIKKMVDKQKAHPVIHTDHRPVDAIFRLSQNVTQDLLASEFGNALNAHLKIADDALEERFSAFGVGVRFDHLTNWHTDPITRKQWPKKFWGDISYRDPRFGGVKFVWEINRLYPLVSLAIAYRYTRDSKYAGKLIHLIVSWLEQNPYPMGVSWTCGIEAGIRLGNLIWALSFLETHPLSHSARCAINQFVWCHATHLLRYPSKYSSANNHTLAEAFGLFIAGAYFPHLPHANTWLFRGKHLLEQEIRRQILPDGGSFEYSTTYLSFVFDFFLLFRHCCQSLGMAYSHEIDAGLEKACDFIKAIMDQNGNIPNIGDQDSAVVVNFGVSNLENFSSVLNTGSILFNRPDLFTGRPDIKTWILTGETLSTESHAHTASPTEQVLALPQEPVLFFSRQSGMASIRDRISNCEILFVGNATPMGLPPLYAHGHLDALSFTLSVGGMQILVDPGTFLYHDGGKWRHYFRSTKAHNTIRINRLELSDQPGDFMFGPPYAITTHRLENDKDGICWQAGHNAYAQNGLCPETLRTVTWDRNLREFTIKDMVHSKQDLFCELFFHFHPDCHIDLADDKVTVTRGHICLEFFADPSLSASLSFGCKDTDGICGWYSPEFNTLKQTHSVIYTGSLAGKAEVNTCLKISV